MISFFLIFLMCPCDTLTLMKDHSTGRPLCNTLKRSLFNCLRQIDHCTNHRPVLHPTDQKAYATNLFVFALPPLISVCSVVGTFVGLINLHGGFHNSLAVIAHDAGLHTTATGISLIIVEYLVILVTICECIDGFSSCLSKANSDVEFSPMHISIHAFCSPIPPTN